ncbi:Las1-domain-containing protein [Teratosphaeria nubilosa]|uniref:Las1-domain-containing protein n=1 Tax=Teratosphaeria nubilosa TaxID=161662 RepID=A0A6G1L444_9PEZI|nr:Las1-domain-containing protein [Teratosphaeria nubilosa]
MPHYTTTPWRHPSDLLTLRSHLYPDPPSPTPPDSTSRHHQITAITQIHAYKLRSPNLPHAIESTALLLDSLHHHTTTIPQNSPHSIRAVYASAFTRFVTGFADIGRAKSGRLAGPENQRSMLQVARGIGMPEEFVALRHEVTHEELPSVGRLRKAVLAGLEWLWEVYWSRLAEEDGVDEVVGEGVREEMRKVLKGYRGARREGFKGRKKQSEDDLVGFYEQIHALLAPGAARLELLAAVLIDEKLLFPSSRVLGASMEGAFKIWDELLTAIDQSVFQSRSNSLTSLLAKNLLEDLPSHTTESDVDAENIYLWLLHLIESQTHREVRAEVMKYCCLHSSYWTERLGEKLLSTGDESFREDWEDLLEASRIANGAPEQGTQGGAADDEEEMSEAGAAAAEPDRELNSTSSHDAGYSMGGGWRLAAVQPSVPIGVVS